MYKPCDSNFNLERHLLTFMQDIPFFAELSRRIYKVQTRDLPTAAIAYDPRYDQITLFTNPDFFEKLSNWEVRGVLTHEFYHFIFNHLTFRRRTPHKLWNIATDLAINSLIVENSSQTRFNDVNDVRPLPKCALIPGQWPVMPDGREMTKEEKEASKIGELISKMPKLQASEFYFAKLKQLVDEEKGPGASDEDIEVVIGGVDSLDDHDGWDDIPEDQREYIMGKVRDVLQKATNHADQSSTGWGNIPQEVREGIRAYLSNVIDWKMVLRQFVGSIIRGHRTSSIKRINRKYPYVHPGVKRGWTAKLLIAMDQSGSVYNEMLEEFFSELMNLRKKVDISILPFDCHADVKEVIEWKKGSNKTGTRTRMGGTDFNAPTAVFNDPKNRGRWDGLLIMTDGMAPEPGTCRGKRGWVLGKDCKLEWSSNEMQICLSDAKKITGAWR